MAAAWQTVYTKLITGKESYTWYETAVPVRSSVIAWTMADEKCKDAVGGKQQKKKEKRGRCTTPEIPAILLVLRTYIYTCVIYTSDAADE